VPDKIVEPPLHTAPAVFTRALLDWRPWLEPLAEERLNERQMAGLVDAVRAKSPYFRLLARDPDALRARTLTDKDIFYNPEAGLPRGERELAAAATSRFNGCIYCASVHARHSATYSKRADDVQRLLDEGVAADLGSAGMPSSPPASRSARHRSPLRRSMWSGCVAPVSTIWRSPTSSMRRHSSTGPIG
jgi:AhpD family alkylhydroperoxidase